MRRRLPLPSWLQRLLSTLPNTGPLSKRRVLSRSPKAATSLRALRPASRPDTCRCPGLTFPSSATVFRLGRSKNSRRLRPLRPRSSRGWDLRRAARLLALRSAKRRLCAAAAASAPGRKLRSASRWLQSAASRLLRGLQLRAAASPTGSGKRPLWLQQQSQNQQNGRGYNRAPQGYAYYGPEQRNTASLDGRRTARPAGPAVADASRGKVVTLAPGETLLSLSKRHGVTVEAIARVNRLSGGPIIPGTRLYIPIHRKSPRRPARPGRRSPNARAPNATPCRKARPSGPSHGLTD